MNKPPFLVRHFQCPSCILKEKKFCTCWGGFQPPMWLVTLRFHNKCITYIDKEPILKQVQVEELEVKIPKSRTPTATTQRRVNIAKEIETRIIAQRNREFNKSSQFQHAKFFKRRHPTTARKLWKPDKKIDKDI